MTTRIPQSEILMRALPALRRSAIIGKNSSGMFLMILGFWTSPREKRRLWTDESTIRQFVVDAIRFAENEDERQSIDFILDVGVCDFDPLGVISMWESASRQTIS